MSNDLTPLERMTGLGEPATKESVEEVPVVVGLFDRKPKTADDFGLASPEPGEPDQETIDLLENLLERAQAGKLTGMIAIVRDSGDPSDPFNWHRTTSIDVDLYTVIGQLETFKTWLTQEALDAALGVELDEDESQ